MYKKNILITTGGTGGHIISGLTIAKYLISKGNIVSWIGTKYRMESILVPKNNIEIDYINIDSFNNYFCIKKIIFYFKLVKCILEAKKILEVRKPNIILGMGNYISIPVCIAGWIKNIPIVIHEQNSIIGLSNKLLYYISNKFLTAFNFNKVNNKKLIFVGNPIRNSILKISNYKNRLKKRKGLIRILVLGGSQGSDFINNSIPKILSNIKKNFYIWHQTGKNNLKYVYNLYYKKFNKLFYIYSIDEFIFNINKAYSWADLIICRSGALTVSEVSCIKLPAIFIPLINKDNHQYFNAINLENLGAAKVFTENCNHNLISDFISKLNRKILINMSYKYNRCNIYNSTKKIVNEILNI